MYNATLDELKYLAEQGDAISLLELGDCYFYGDCDVNVDYEQAIDYYNKASKSGCSLASLAIAECYYNGTGVEKDKKKAIKWYRKASEQGDPTAQAVLNEIQK